MLRLPLRCFVTLPSSKLPPRLPIAGVRQVLLVTSAKGGVGKSTVSVNLAVALTHCEPNLTVGLLDADIYGPSIPRLLGVEGLRPDSDEKGRILPVMNYGIKTLSMGNLVGDADPIVWRGPIVMSAVAWGPLDLLVVDMPPGTGDVQLSISQNIPVDGAIIITTPQGLAVSNARRGLEMLKKVNIPILGIVENMSDFTCPSCGHRSLLFHDDCDPMTPIKDKTSGGLGLAEATGTQLLARLPIDQRICTSGELGRPLVLGLAANSIAHPGTAVHQPASLQAYDQLARLLLTRLSEKFSPRP